MKRFFNLWRDKLFKFTHALILPLSVLFIASLILLISEIILVWKPETYFAVFLWKIAESLFYYMPLLVGSSLIIYFVKLNKIYAMFAYLVATVIFYVSQNSLIIFNEKGNFFDVFYLHNEGYFNYFVTSNIGLNILNTSYFGSFCLSALTIYIMNHCSDFEFSRWFSLIDKERFVPFILIPLTMILSLLLVVVWPYFGRGLSFLLIKSKNLNYGFDMFLYSMLTRILKPFGVNHIFSSLILKTSTGGILSVKDFMIISEKLEISHFDKVKKFTDNLVNFSFKNGSIGIFGQQSILSFIKKLSFNDLPIDNRGFSIPILSWMSKYLHLNIGQFTQDYSIYFGVYLGIGIAIIINAPKNKKRIISSVVIPGIFIAIFSGVSEPLEFIILFAAPFLYFGLYVPICSFCLMFMKLFGAHIGPGLSNGLIDFIFNGIVNCSKGTKFWVVFPISIFQGGFSFISFYFILKKFNYSKINHSEYNAIYLNKKEYVNLIKISFTEIKNSKKNLSLKQEIHNYILENIKNKKWKEGKKILSEESLAIKFNCSRLTARQTLVNLVSIGILSSVKGKGYFVENFNKSKFISFNDNFSESKNQIIKSLHHQKIKFCLKWLKDIEKNFQDIDLIKTHIFEKKSFGINKQLVIYEISILNKNEVFFTDTNQINHSLVQYLTKQGIDITKNSSALIFLNEKKYSLIAEELGWKNEYPAIISIFSNDSDWIEISLKLVAKSSFIFSQNFKIFK